MAGFNQEELRFIKEHGIFLGIRDAAENKIDSLLNGSDRVYGIISVTRKNSGDLTGLVKTAIRNGYGQLKLELCGKGRWSVKEIENLRSGLRELGDFLVLAILKKREFSLTNMEDLLDANEGCKIFYSMLLANAKGDYLLVPPQWRHDGRGVKLGNVDNGIKQYHGCVYDANSNKCRECEKSNFERMNKLYDGNATAEFNAGIAKIFESVRYLSRNKPAFKVYLAKLLKNKEMESGLFINDGAKKR